jgi:hypothetical protein
MKGDILKARVNSTIGVLFVGSFALLASVIIWESSFDYNPLAKAFEQHYAPVFQELK